MNKTRKRLFDIIQIGNTSDRPSRYFDIFIAVVIIANVAVLFLETFQPYMPRRKKGGISCMRDECISNSVSGSGCRLMYSMPYMIG